MRFAGKMTCLTCSLLLLVDGASACTLDIDATKFFSKASNGLKPISTPEDIGPSQKASNTSDGANKPSMEKCSTIQPKKNEFYAPPGASCMLLFKSDEWLKEGLFQQIEGNGQFSSEKIKEGILITIEAAGGFRASSFRISVDKETCDRVSVTELVR